MLSRGRYRARFAAGAADVAAAQGLRHLCFRGGAGRDEDRFDAACAHVLVEDVDGGRLVGCFRLQALTGEGISDSYAGQVYDLSRLAGFPGPMVELGRFCIHPDARDADILRVAWGALTRHVDAHRIALLFGCASFRGTDPAPYRDSLALLAAGHLAPERWRPGVKAAEVVRFAGWGGADRRAGLAGMPPLLRTYLAMGGWVSDHAVVDREMGTLHVFTGVEIGRVPERRARALRAL
ncbi:Putative hemolysin [Oceanicola granulosus HTCC2516]|uniref:L-ornithine N(alpha)-acyltransferase n=1 Tax=Oceanicola granulosus (strain ATCC BAA-861 / DSM 15982 / KCTC 12143 / HTCC2516) TaxID=314256 RepID=Q2CDU9_OCEGH|nr:GNAT family N-acyltransferase [Oceanicola granulosus]EAR50879.1 Putative hemolysin [Oceanicola granulosus HTCC2516]